MSLCCYCKKENGKYTCSECFTVKYCSDECQKADWKTHKLECIVQTRDYVTIINSICDNKTFIMIIEAFSHYGSIGDPHFFLHGQISIKDENTFICIVTFHSDSTKNFIPNKRNVLLSYMGDGSLVMGCAPERCKLCFDFFSEKGLDFSAFETKVKLIVGKHNGFCVIDLNGRIIAISS